MSLTLLNKKFDALKLKEQQIEHHYDPQYKHSKNDKKYKDMKQHRHIVDLREDYQEDLENYGFTKQSFKPKKEPELETLTIGKVSTQRPMTAMISPQSAVVQKQRPITAPGLNVKVANMIKVEDNNEIQSTGYHTQSKYWRNTKKYDVANDNLIRNHSALKKINLESDDYNIEVESFKNSAFIEKKIISNRLFTPLGRHEIRHYKSEKDIKQLTDGFMEHLSYYKPSKYAMSQCTVDEKLAEVIRLIGADNTPVVSKAKYQGLRPQTAIKKSSSSRSSQIRPISGIPHNILVRGQQL